MLEKHLIALLSAGTILSSCAGPQSGVTMTRSLPTATDVQARGTLLRAAPPAMAPQWGVGLRAPIVVQAGDSYIYTFCQDRGSYPCPNVHYGMRASKYAISKRISNPAYGTASAAHSASTVLFGAIYSHADAASALQSNAVGAYGETDFYWYDTLHLKSTLKKGTPVALGVTLTLTPSVTNVLCDGESSAQLNFSGPGMDANGSALDIEGSCEGTAFIYRLNAPLTGPLGTIDTGTLTGYIGQPITLAGDGFVNTGACNPAGSCVTPSATMLAGSIKWIITSITPGVTYTTASGNTYR